MKKNTYLKRRKRNRKIKKIAVIASSIVIVVTILIVIGVCIHSNQNTQDVAVSGEAATKVQAQTDQNNASGEADKETHDQKNDDTIATNTADSKENAHPAPKVLNDPIEDIPSLDSESHGWGQGNNVDELNRSVSCDQFQEKYARYHADFIQPADKKVIYLTFDEGYEYGLTSSILDTLKEKQVKAVFFVTKSYAEKDPALVQRIIDDGHILGNHSVTHPLDGLPSLTIEQQKEEVMGNHDYVKETFGYEMYLFRFPVGLFSEQSLAVVNNCNYHSVFWSFAYLDYDVNNQPDEQQSYEKLVSKLHPGAIYLLHPESQTNADILGEFIDEARAEGYTIGDYDDTLN